MTPVTAQSLDRPPRLPPASTPSIEPTHDELFSARMARAAEALRPCAAYIRNHKAALCIILLITVAATCGMVVGLKLLLVGAVLCMLYYGYQYRKFGKELALFEGRTNERNKQLGIPSAKNCSDARKVYDILLPISKHPPLKAAQIRMTTAALNTLQQIVPKHYEPAVEEGLKDMEYSTAPPCYPLSHRACQRVIRSDTQHAMLLDAPIPLVHAFKAQNFNLISANKRRLCRALAYALCARRGAVPLEALTKMYGEQEAISQETLSEAAALAEHALALYGHRKVQHVFAPLFKASRRLLHS